VKNPQLFPPFLKYQIRGDSMLPTYKAGDVVLVSRLSYLIKGPKVNDIIVLTDPRNGSEILKRITAITKKRYFVKGDNASASTDSREFGWVEKKLIVGKVILKL
jgi:nickel-type superoxide dismutase maturation protease